MAFSPFLFGQARARARVVPPRGRTTTPDPEEPPPEEGLTLITTIAVDDGGSSAQTNIPVEFGLPLSSPEFATVSLQSNERIVVYEGETRLVTQEDNRATDRNGKIRVTTVCALLPELDAGATKVLSIYKEAGSPATGPSMTVSDLLALDEDAECDVTADTGTVYHCSFREAAAGSTTWTRGEPHFRKWWHDGPLRKSFVCMAFMKDGSNNNHTHLFTEFCATAYSTDEFVSDIRWRFDPMLQPGWADAEGRHSPIFDLTVTTGIASPSTQDELPSYAPADVSITVDNRTVTASTTGVFNANHHGRVIVVSGGGMAMINSIVEDGSGCGLRGAATLASATYAAGEWKLIGFHLPDQGCLWRKEVWHGTRPNYVVRHESAYLFDCGMLLNCALPSAYINFPSAGVGNSGTGSITTMERNGNYPIPNRSEYVGEHPLGTAVEGRPCASHQWKKLRKLEGDIGPHVAKFIVPFIYYTADAWGMKGDAWTHDDFTGLLVNGGVTMPGSRNRAAMVDGTGGNGYPSRVGPLLLPVSTTPHIEGHFYIPYLLTGRFFYLKAQVQQAFFNWLYMLTFNSLGLERPLWVTNTSRAKAWGDRDFATAALCMPDDAGRELIGWSKADLLGQGASTWFQAHRDYLDDGTGNTGWSKWTPAGPNFTDPDDPFWIPHNGNNNITEPSLMSIHPGWQTAYLCHNRKFLQDIGMLTTEGAALYTRWVRHHANFYMSPKIANPNDLLGGSGSHANFPRWYRLVGHGDNGLQDTRIDGPPYPDWDEISEYFINSGGNQKYYAFYTYAAMTTAREDGIDPDFFDEALAKAVEVLRVRWNQDPSGTDPYVINVPYNDGTPLVFDFWVAPRS